MLRDKDEVPVPISVQGLIYFTSSSQVRQETHASPPYLFGKHHSFFLGTVTNQLTTTETPTRCWWFSSLALHRWPGWLADARKLVNELLLNGSCLSFSSQLAQPGGAFPGTSFSGYWDRRYWAMPPRPQVSRKEHNSTEVAFRVDGCLQWLTVHEASPAIRDINLIIPSNNVESHFMS